jgi:hypothetical protein
LQALWLASEGIEWTQGCIPEDYSKWVKEQVLPLRKMRRNMKTDWSQYEDFRQQVKALELKAEQYALAMLYQQSSSGVITTVAQNHEVSGLLAIAEFSNIAFDEFRRLQLII